MRSVIDETDSQTGDGKRVVFARVSPNVHRGLKESARRHKRSMTQQVELIVEQHIAADAKQAGVEPEATRREPGSQEPDQAAA